MGTPDFAGYSLAYLINRGYPVKAVVTQPDKPQGRHNLIVPPPVKTLALQHNLPVFQPESLPDIQRELQQVKPDFVVVVAYGQILDTAALGLACRVCATGAHRGCINLHASLLPQYRGASPIQAAIRNGDPITGVSTMLMEPGLDTGPVLLQQEVTIQDQDTFATLHDKLALAGAQLLDRTLRNFETIMPRPQDPGRATYTEKISKQSGMIDWRQSAASIRNLVRACDPWPAAFTYCGKQRIILWDTCVVEGEATGAAPGQIQSIHDKHGIVVATGQARIGIRELQREGKKRQRFDSFVRGQHLAPGTLFSTKPE